jgi:hypothetical protein
LLNPERIWQQEQQLDDLSEGRADEGPLPAQSAPDAAAAE